MPAYAGHLFGSYGYQMYIALLDTEDEVREYVEYIIDKQARIVIPSLYA